MARPVKNGLDYFPLDIDFFEDEKIEAISGEFGTKGEIATIRLLCSIYRNGYYIKWNEMLKMKLLRKMPGISAELLDQIVTRLVLWDFFDKALFDSAKILTSKGIQNRFNEATKRRTLSGIKEYSLLERVNVNKNPTTAGINVNNNTQSKVKESKGERGAHALAGSNLFRKAVIPTFEEVHRVFMNNGGSEEMAKKFFDTYTATEWFYKGSPIRNFSSLVPGFVKTWNKNNGQEQPASTKKGMVL